MTTLHSHSRRGILRSLFVSMAAWLIVFAANSERLAAAILGEMGSEAKDAVPALIVAVKDSNDEVLNNAVIALGNIGADAEKAISALTETTKDTFHFTASGRAKRAIAQISVHRELLDAEKLFMNGDLDAAQTKLDYGLQRYELLLNTHRDLASHDNALDQGLWAIILWQKIYQLKNQTDPKDFPLKWLWELEARRLPPLQQEFNRRYGPP